MSRPNSSRAGDSGSRADRAERVWSLMNDLVLDQDRRQQVSAELGISFFRTKVLRRLLPAPATMRDLAAVLGADKSYLSVTVEDLEQRGLVERSVHPEDRRVRLVTLTPAGVAAATRANELLSSPPPGLNTLSPAELDTIEQLLRKATEMTYAAGPDRTDQA